MFKRVVFVILFSLLIINGFSESSSQKIKYKDVDSLKLVIDKLIKVDGSIECADSVIKFVTAHRKLLKEEFPVYLHQILKKINTAQDTSCLAEIYYRIGVNHRYTHVYDSAKYYYKKALPFARKSNDYYLLDMA